MEQTEILKKIEEKHSGAVKASTDRYGVLEVLIDRKAIADVVKTLRDKKDLAFDMLIDLVSIDYSLMPERTGDRFGVAYILKSLTHGHRFQLKVTAPEDDAVVPSISGLYKNADWLEREAFDQMGIRFSGHPNLKRLLNHHEFVGHPLRKDYPITRRQWLSANESLMDEMDVRLKEKGYE